MGGVGAAGAAFGVFCALDVLGVDDVLAAFCTLAAFGALRLAAPGAGAAITTALTASCGMPARANAAATSGGKMLFAHVSVLKKRLKIAKTSVDIARAAIKFIVTMYALSQSVMTISCAEQANLA